jgi:Alternative complex III, ActD subunit
MPKDFLVATFSDAERLIQAVRVMRGEKFRIYDVYAPYPVHNLEEAMGIRRSRLPWVTLMLGASGLLLALLLQFYTEIFDWPLNVGGKPDNSTLAFVPISFELTVLIGGLATVAALFVRARLYPGKRESLIVEGVTNNAFALVLRKRDASFDVSRARLLLEDNGAKQIEEKAAEL